MKLEKVEGPYEKASIEEVMKALHFKNDSNATGPSGVMSEPLKLCEKENINRLAKVANDVVKGKKVPKN